MIKESNPNQPPPGYSIIQSSYFGEVLIQGEKDSFKEFFRLTDREFSAIDHYLGYLPSQFIEYLIEKRKRTIRVADIGGGRKSLTAKGIAEKYKDDVCVYNVDLIHNPSPSHKNLRRVSGDVCNLPFGSESIDLALSYQFFPFLENDGNYTKAIKVLKEIVRVLTPGGIALIDEDYLASLSFSDPLRQRLFMEDNIVLSTRRGNHEKGEITFGPPRTLLLVEKMPIDFGAAMVQERLIGQF